MCAQGFALFLLVDVLTLGLVKNLPPLGAAPLWFPGDVSGPGGIVLGRIEFFVPLAVVAH